MEMPLQTLVSLSPGLPVCLSSTKVVRTSALTGAGLDDLAEAVARVLLGGAPIDGERHIFWNFVSSSQARIELAKRDWREGRFPRVPGDEQEFIPLPD